MESCIIYIYLEARFHSVDRLSRNSGVTNYMELSLGRSIMRFARLTGFYKFMK